MRFLPQEWTWPGGCRCWSVARKLVQETDVELRWETEVP